MSNTEAMTNTDLLKTAMREHQAGQLKEADQHYRQVLSAEPARPDALEGLGLLSLQLGRRDESLQLLRRATVAAPSTPSVFLNLGAALDEVGQYQEAIAAYHKAISLKPDYSRAYSNLGNTLRKVGMIQEAISACRRALVIKPDSPQTHNNLGAALLDLNPDEAMAHFQIALNLRPEYAEALDGMGSAMLRKGKLDEAVKFCRRAVQIKPGLHEGQVNLGTALAASAVWDVATGCFERAIELSPQSAIAHWNLGLMRLLRGDFARGWPEYEWRLRVGKFKPAYQSQRPLWDGAALNGRRILLFAEQGLGDAIQFARFIPEVARRGGKVSLICHRQLQRLFNHMEHVELCAAFDEPAPEHEVQFPLLSLAGLFKTDLSNLPAKTPYITADPVLSGAWKARVPAEGKIKIGLVWAGKMVPLDRSIPVTELAALSQFEKFWFCSLQKWEPGQTPAAPQLPITDWTSELNDLADTAGLIDNLDAVITIDTSMAHLAGAMGKKTWVLLRNACDWRWMLDRTDSPWYPSVTLCRQKRAGEWAEPMEQLVAGLKNL